jgi:CBS domain-containing protein
LDHVDVADIRHHGILRRAGDASLGRVAAIMAEPAWHAVAVTNGEGLRRVGVVSDLDVISTSEGTNQ